MNPRSHGTARSYLRILLVSFLSPPAPLYHCLHEQVRQSPSDAQTSAPRLGACLCSPVLCVAALTGEPSHEHGVVGVCGGRRAVRAAPVHLSVIHGQRQTVLHLLCEDPVPLPVTQAAWRIGLVGSGEPACAVVNVEQHLESDTGNSAPSQNNSFCLFALLLKITIVLYNL